MPPNISKVVKGITFMMLGAVSYAAGELAVDHITEHQHTQALELTDEDVYFRNALRVFVLGGLKWSFQDISTIEYRREIDITHIDPAFSDLRDQFMTLTYHTSRPYNGMNIPIIRDDLMDYREKYQRVLTSIRAMPDACSNSIYKASIQSWAEDSSHAAELARSALSSPLTVSSASVILEIWSVTDQPIAPGNCQ